MTYELLTTPEYERRAKRFLKKRRHLTELYQQCFTGLAENPFQPKWGTHLLKGKYSGYYAVVLTGSYRIIVEISRERQLVLFHDIGTHEDVYK